MADVYLIRSENSTLVEVSRSTAEELKKIFPSMEVIIQRKLDNPRKEWDGTFHACEVDCSARQNLIYG